MGIEHALLPGILKEIGFVVEAYFRHQEEIHKEAREKCRINTYYDLTERIIESAIDKAEKAYSSTIRAIRKHD